jgi:membrane protease YdiL (CAAX protease family)
MEDHDPGVEADITWIEPGSTGDDRDGVEATAPECWRCGKVTEAGRTTCPYCRASLSPAVEPVAPAPRPRGRAVMVLLATYLGLLITLVFYSATIKIDRLRDEPATDEEIRDLLVKTVIVEAAGAVLVVVGIAWAGRPPAPPRIGWGRRIAAWLVAVPAIVALLAANFVYVRMLKEALGLPTIELGTAHRRDLIPWLVLTVCVQPAIVEELLFRYLILGHLRPVVGPHGAVFLSGVMFGLAHLFNPLCIPYLIVAGFVFGYARVFGRSLALPMLLHFVHNAAVIFWSDTWI